MAQAIPFGVSALGGLLGKLGGNKPATSTSTTNSSSTQTGNLLGPQKKVNKLLGARLKEWLGLGPQVSEADRNRARLGVNQTFDAAGHNLEANLTARGFGDSGKLNKGFGELELGRSNQIQNTEGTLTDQAMQRFMSAMQLGQNYIQPRQYTTEGTSTTTGQQTMPGQGTMGAIGSGIGDLASLMFMAKRFGGPGFDPNAGGVCFIAIELYGPRSWQAIMVRGYLIERARGSRAWRVGLAIYRLCGKHVANLLRAFTPARRPAHLFFDSLLRKALNA